MRDNGGENVKWSNNTFVGTRMTHWSVVKISYTNKQSELSPQGWDLTLFSVLYVNRGYPTDKNGIYFVFQ